MCANHRNTRGAVVRSARVHVSAPASVHVDGLVDRYPASSSWLGFFDFEVGDGGVGEAPSGPVPGDGLVGADVGCGRRHMPSRARRAGGHRRSPRGTAAHVPYGPPARKSQRADGERKQAHDDVNRSTVGRLWLSVTSPVLLRTDPSDRNPTNSRTPGLPRNRLCARADRLECAHEPDLTWLRYSPLQQKKCRTLGTFFPIAVSTQCPKMASLIATPSCVVVAVPPKSGVKGAPAGPRANTVSIAARNATIVSDLLPNLLVRLTILGPRDDGIPGPRRRCT